MKKEYIKEIVKQGEGLSIEFKESKQTLNKDVYETVCAFLNRTGGTIILGVKDSGDIVGINTDCVEKIKKEDFRKRYLKPLIDKKLLNLTRPENINHPKQKYYS